jgi:hypothetical protein
MEYEAPEITMLGSLADLTLTADQYRGGKGYGAWDGFCQSDPHS